MFCFPCFLWIYFANQLILVGVCCSGRGDGTDPYEQLSLQPLPEYTIPSDGVTMTCITCTDRGHIFLAGRDGHIYEMQYTTGSGWHKWCRKVCLTAGLGNVISRYFPSHVHDYCVVPCSVFRCSCSWKFTIIVLF